MLPELRPAEVEGEPYQGREYSSADDVVGPDGVRELLERHGMLPGAQPRARAMKVLTVLGTRPEIIRLSRVIERLDRTAT